MSDSNAIKAGAAYVELFLKDGLTKGLKAASSRLKAWGGAMQSIGTRIAAVGGLVTAPILAAVQSFVATGDKLNDMATRTGVAVEALSGLAHAAEMSGTDLDVLEKGLIGMAKGLFSAEQGSKKLNKLLTQYGVSLGTIESLSPEEQFLALADVVARIENPTTRAAMAMQLFGKSGQKLLPMLSGGRAGIAALQAEAAMLGRTMSTEDAQAAAEMDDAWNRLKSVLAGVRNVVGAALVPTFLQAAETLKEWGLRVVSFIKDHRQLIVTLFKVVVAATAIGAGLAAVGTAIVGVGAVLGGMAAIASTVGAAFGAIVTAIGAVLSPIGLVTAAVVGLAGYFAWSSGAIGQMVDWLKQQFTDLAGWIKDVWAGIRDALAAGDLALAGQVAIGALKVAWAAGVNTLTNAWISFKTTVVETWHDVTYAIVDYAMKAWADLKIGFAETVAGLKILWADFAASVADKWEGAQRAIAKPLARQIAKAQGNDPEEAARAVDDDYNRRRRNRRAETEAYKSQVAAEMTAKTDALKANRDATAQAYREDAQRAATSRRRQYDAQAAAAQNELDAAKADLAASIAAAKGNNMKARAGSEMPAMPAPGDLQAAVASAGMGGKGSVAGSFSALALAGMGRGNAADRTAKATEESAGHLRKLVKGQKSGHFVFSGDASPL